MPFLVIILPILLFILGVCLASFGNVLICRYPNWKQSKERKYSECMKCHHRLAWYDLFPIFSYIFLRGKCRYCKEKISPQYIIVELSGGLIFLLSYFAYIYFYHFDNASLSFVLGPVEPVFEPIAIVSFISVAISLLLVLLGAFIDHKHREVPLSFMIIVFALALIKWGITFGFSGNYNLILILGLAIPFGLFLIIYLISTFVFKVEAMGLADMILYCSLGLMLGIYQFILILLISAVTCSIVESVKIKKTGEKRKIPFVPYIFLGYAVAGIFGEAILLGYMKLIGVR